MRADASVDIGSGHLMRCLTLADQLRGMGAEVAFVCRDLPGAMFDMLQARGYQSAKLPMAEAGNGAQHFDAQETIRAAGRLFPDGMEWLVVDHYELDAVWENMLRPHVCKLMVIDDLANRSHDCDLLLDQNYYRDMDQRYQGLVPEQCVTLLGPAYVLLRPEFAETRQRLRVRDGSVRRIMVFFGGTDSTNQTRKALDALKLVARPQVAIDIIVGASNPYRDEIQSLCCQVPNTQYHCQVSNMAELISAADIAIGAGGATTWERCSLGLPTLTVVFADNQLQTTLDLQQIGATIFIGWADKITVSDLAHAIGSLIENPALLRNISDRASFVMSQWQGVGAIAAAMKNIFTNFKRACG